MMKHVAQLLIAVMIVTTATPAWADDPAPAAPVAIVTAVPPTLVLDAGAAALATHGSAIPTALLDAASTGASNAADSVEYTEFLIVLTVVAITGYGYIAFAPEH
jgi:hypothetical protein